MKKFIAPTAVLDLLKKAFVLSVGINYKEKTRSHLVLFNFIALNICNKLNQNLNVVVTKINNNKQKLVVSLIVLEQVKNNDDFEKKELSKR